MDERRFRCALVTGASAGLGEEFARQLAPRCGILVLVARRVERLQATAAALRAAYPGLVVRVAECDLADAAARAGMVAELAADGVAPDLLVNNAGLGDYGEFVSSEWPKVEAMLKVNVEALTHLTYLLLPGMLGEGNALEGGTLTRSATGGEGGTLTRSATKGGGWRGGVINVSSLASLVPIPDFAVYAATKAYVTSFSEALRMELRGSGIPVLAVCPGPVSTEFGEVAQRAGGGKLGTSKLIYVAKEKVVREALVALVADRARLFPGWQVAALAALISVVPICLVRLAMAARPRQVR